MIDATKTEELRRLVKKGIQERDWRQIHDVAKILGITFDTRYINPEGMKAGRRPRVSDEELRAAIPTAPSVWESP